jgi:hypothetical protein
VEGLKGRAEKFIAEYLKEIRYLASTLPRDIHSVLPSYWTRPHKVIITVSSEDGLAIYVSRPVGGKMDKFSLRTTNHLIERAIFDKLNYSLPAFFRIERGVTVTIYWLTVVTTAAQPSFNLTEDAFLRIFDMRFESSPPIPDAYPAEKLLLWLFAQPANERLSIDTARSYAYNDFPIQTRNRVFASLPNLMAKDLHKESLDFLMSLASEVLQDFDKLISRQDLDEQMLQEFLQNHYIILSPHTTPNLTKRQIGSFRPDFILQYDNGRRVLVELQLNNDTLFRGNSMSVGLADAVEQMKDWFQWIGQNEPFLLPKTEGIIVIGRTENYLKNKESVDKAIASIGHNVKLLTYDDLRNTLLQIIRQLSMSPRKRSRS